MNDLTIRPMRTEDLDAASRLAAMLVRQHHAFDADRFMLLEPVEQGYRWFLASQLDQADALLLVAEVDGITAGYLYGAIEARNWALLLDRHGAIHDVWVDPAFRRRGIARALLTEAFARLDPQVPRVVLSSATANHEAQRLFASLGFRSTMVEMTRTPRRPGLGDSAQ
jgi:ribosomal protein S18 acetylase RimI-like enzyme